jgi:hypothetical protein
MVTPKQPLYAAESRYRLGCSVPFQLASVTDQGCSDHLPSMLPHIEGCLREDGAVGTIPLMHQPIHMVMYSVNRKGRVRVCLIVGCCSLCIIAGHLSREGHVSIRAPQEAQGVCIDILWTLK